MSLITLTSSFGSGGDKIAQMVSEKTGIDIFDDQKLQERALAIGISSTDLEGLDEKAPRLFDRIFTNKPALYKDILGSVVYDIASSGEGLIMGHGAQLFLEDFDCALHVMIHASEEKRAKWLSKEQNISVEAAAKIINNMDKRLKNFSQYVFDRDWKDFSGYDLVINLEKLEADWAVKLIVDLAASDEIKTCSLKALEAMEISSLKRKIDTILINNSLSSIQKNIFVDVPVRGKVHLWGWAKNEDEVKRIIKLVNDVPGVSDFTSEISIIPYSGWV